MSLITEILDRLTGIAIVREKLSEAARTADRIGEAVLDHEKRLVRLETTLFPPSGPLRSERTALPKK